MSASEKLKALNEGLLGPPWDYDWNAPQNVLASDGSGKHVGRIPDPTAKQLIALRNALPQIVAVVEAAELARDFMQAVFPDGVGRPAAVGITSAALAALEEALA